MEACIVEEALVRPVVRPQKERWGGACVTPCAVREYCIIGYGLEECLR